MKTIILLTLISLSFAFIPKDLLNRNDPNADSYRGFLSVSKDKYDSVSTTQLNNSTDDSLLLNNETESSSDDYYIDYSFTSDESDWNGYNTTNTTYTSWADNSTYNDSIPTNETYPIFEYDSNFTTSNNFTEELYDYPSDQTDLGDENFYDAILSSAIASLFNETIEEDVFSILVKLIDINDLNDLNDLNITDEDVYDTLKSIGFDNITLLVFNGSLLQDNVTKLSSINDYILVVDLYSDESDWISNITNSTQFDNITYSTFIPLNETYSIIDDDTNSTMTKSFSSTFKNFTEALTDYLLNNIENNFEEDKFYDEVLSSIALLFNQTIEEKALFGFEQGENN